MDENSKIEKHEETIREVKENKIMLRKKHRKILKDIKNIIKKANVAMYPIMKTYSKKPEKMRKVLRVKIEGEVAKFFRNVLNERIEYLIEDDEKDFSDFFSEYTMPEDILYIDDITPIATLTNVIIKINQITNLDPVKEFDEKTLKNLQSYAVEVRSNENERFIYFKKYAKGAIISSKWATLIHREGAFNKLEGDIFKIDGGIDCIYYENEFGNGVYVLNKEEFEEIFSFMELYKKESEKAQEALESSDYVDIKEGLFDEIKEKKTYIKKIALLNKRDAFKNLEENFEDIEKKHSEAEKLKFDIEDNKVIIENKEALKDFLDILENNILRDLINKKLVFRTKHKTLL